MKKFGAFIGKITRDDFRVNAFYDAGLRVFFILMYVLSLSGVVELIKAKPIFIFFVIDILLAFVLFVILGVTNLIKRRRSKNLDNLHGKYANISSILMIVGILLHLRNTFIFYNSEKIPILTVISIVLLIGSIGFYLVGYKQTKRNLLYEKIA